MIYLIVLFCHHCQAFFSDHASSPPYRWPYGNPANFKIGYFAVALSGSDLVMTKAEIFTPKMKKTGPNDPAFVVILRDNLLFALGQFPMSFTAAYCSNGALFRWLYVISCVFATPFNPGKFSSATYEFNSSLVWIRRREGFILF